MDILKVLYNEALKSSCLIFGFQTMVETTVDTEIRTFAYRLREKSSKILTLALA